jgi:hypothetical protein
MNDDRLDPIIAAVKVRYPGARVEYGLDPAPYTARIPVFQILLDADADLRHEAAGFALQLGIATFGREDLPYVVSCVTPETWARYCRDVAAELAQEAAPKS